MLHRFFTQDHWQGIRFAELGVPLNPTEPATATFYERFYSVLATRYKSFEELPRDWRLVKSTTANEIIKLMDPASRVLSYGAGLGYIESLLIRQHGFRDLYLWDFATTAAAFDTELAQRYLGGSEFPEFGSLRFNVLYLVQVLYALDQDQTIDLLRNLRIYPFPGSRAISFDTSSVPGENGVLGVSGSRRLATRRWLSRLGRTLDRNWEHRSASRGQQGWGWQRDAECTVYMFERAGNKNIQMTSGAEQSIIIGHAP